MKRSNRIFAAAGCIVLIIISWAVVLNSKSNGEKQAELISQAETYIKDEVYVLAVPLLEEAAGYEAAHTPEAEKELKIIYLQLIDQKGYRRKYTELLEKQMNRKNAPPEIFFEAASYYLEISKYSEAYAILKKGIAKTGDDSLADLYESNRYRYNIGHSIYENVTAISGSTVGVQANGFWGLANSDGTLLIPCEYEKISACSSGRAIVMKNGKIFAVDKSNNRLALAKENAIDFGNYADDRVTLLTNEGWKRASGDFEMGSAAFEEIGTYSNGYAAAKQNGKWGLVDKSTKWLIPAEYDRIMMDELGRSYAQSAAFVAKGDSVYLFVGGKQLETPYEDAKPFGDEGYAAVKKNGKWGFVDTKGEVMINFQFEDALSFGQHLAAIKDGEFWGYVSLYGKIAIEPIFLQAKSFSDGNAPVLTNSGWQFITLLEYKKGAGFF